MKKIFLFSFLSLFASLVFAQLKVMPDGKVGIGIGNQTPLSNPFAVGGTYASYFTSYFEGAITPLLAINTGNVTNYGGYTGVAIYGYSELNSPAGDIAVRGDAFRGSPVNTGGYAMGMRGIAGNAKSGYNYGVLGVLTGTNNGSAIHGDVYNVNGIPVDGKYAGYFNGNVKVTGTVNGTVIGSSDIRFKQNVTDLGGSNRGSRDILNTITSLNPVSYNYKQIYYDLPQRDTIQAPVGHFDEESQLFKKKHFGLIAQDLQKVYPDLVYENDNGYLSINYTELIPLLIQSIKELKEEVDLLSISARSSVSSDRVSDLPRAVLYQNAPNPFTERTEIKFDLPENTSSAYIYIFNMQGTLVKQIPVSNFQASITINGSELTAGMYLYSLIVDGKEIDTKRMILTR